MAFDPNVFDAVPGSLVHGLNGQPNTAISASDGQRYPVAQGSGSMVQGDAGMGLPTDQRWAPNSEAPSGYHVTGFTPNGAWPIMSPAQGAMLMATLIAGAGALGLGEAGMAGGAFDMGVGGIAESMGLAGGVEAGSVIGADQLASMVTEVIDGVQAAAAAESGIANTAQGLIGNQAGVPTAAEMAGELATGSGASAAQTTAAEQMFTEGARAVSTAATTAATTSAAGGPSWLPDWFKAMDPKLQAGIAQGLLSGLGGMGSAALQGLSLERRAELDRINKEKLAQYNRDLIQSNPSIGGGGVNIGFRAPATPQPLKTTSGAMVYGDNGLIGRRL